MTDHNTLEESAVEATPDTMPQEVPGERSIAARWNVGSKDAMGRQPQVELDVTHWTSSKDYRAVLSLIRVEPTDHGVVEHRNLGFDAPMPQIYQHAALRFNRTKLRTVYEAALTELRRRFADGDEEVTAFFDPTSDVFTH